MRQNDNINQKGNQMSIVETTYCEKHNIPSYHMSDGTVKHTCSTCHPETLPAKGNHFRIQNYGAHDAAVLRVELDPNGIYLPSGR